MWVFNRFLEQTGTIKYENDQVMVSGLKDYSNPFITQTGVRFAVVKRDTYIRSNQESNTAVTDTVIAQFGWNQLKLLNATGIYMKPERTRLVYDGDEFRATNVNDFGVKYTRNYMPMGVVEVIFKKRKRIAD